MKILPAFPVRVIAISIAGLLGVVTSALSEPTRIANGPLAESLAAVARLVESHSPDSLCTVMLREGERLRVGAAPSLPHDYCEAIHGISIGPCVGSCGTAAYTGEPFYVEDLATHPHWAAFRDLAVSKFGLRACWSTPIRSYEGQVIATFAMYYQTPKLPTLRERKLIDFSSHLVAIAVNRHRDRAALSASQS